MVAKKKADPWLLSRSELARAFAVTPLRITKWTAAGMPVADRGARGRESKYDLHDVITWYVARELAARGIGTGKRLDLASERAHLSQAQRKLAELDYHRKVGALVSAQEVELRWSGIITAVRDRLLGLPVRLKARVPELTRDQVAVLDELVRQDLEELATREDPEHQGDAPPD